MIKDEDPNVICDNKYYALCVGESVHDKDAGTCYQIINKEYGIVEIETFNLVMAYLDLDKMTDALNKILQERAIIDIPDKNVITLN
jgi:hypothetical protein